MSKFQFPTDASCLIKVKQKQSHSMSSLLDHAEKDSNIEVVNEKPKLTNYMSAPCAEKSRKCRTPRENSFLMRISKKKAPRRRSRRSNKSVDFMGKLRKNAEAGKVECFRVDDDVSKTESQLNSKDLQNIEMLTGSAGDFLVDDGRASTGSVRKRRKKIFRMSAGTSPQTCYVGPRDLVEQENKVQEPVLVFDFNVPQKSEAASDETGLEQNEVLKLQKEVSTLNKKVQLQKVSLDILSSQKEKLEELFKRQNKDIKNKNRSIQTLSLKLRWITKELAKNEEQFAKKDEIIDIQGQFIEKLEEEIVGLNQQLQSNSIVPRRRSQDLQDLNTEYRRISLAQG